MFLFYSASENDGRILPALRVTYDGADFLATEVKGGGATIVIQQTVSGPIFVDDISVEKNTTFLRRT